MFEELKKKSGWFEEPSVMNEKGKLVAKDHHEALIKAQYKKTSPSCVCIEPCNHKKEDIVDEIDDNQEEDKRNNKIDKKEEADDSEDKEDKEKGD
ncbi:MAG: hypothetical protein OIN86_04710 [Candidatus Methanoperedens sp.]|nr:hypothetical protein [Candidatus Methanoperedens sp.]CAG0996886.1 hypothetical protein METP1_02625 [Methanosarcinales archaeon]